MNFNFYHKSHKRSLEEINLKMYQHRSLHNLKIKISSTHILFLMLKAALITLWLIIFRCYNSKNYILQNYSNKMVYKNCSFAKC